MQGFNVSIVEMPSDIPGFVIPESSEVRTTSDASSDEQDDHPTSAQKLTSDEEAPTVGLKPFNSRRRGMRTAKVAPEEDDVSSEEYDGSDNDNAGSTGSEGPSRNFRPEIVTYSIPFH